MTVTMDGNVEFQLDKQRKLLYRRMVAGGAAGEQN